jgi:hypothetical protein
MDLDGDPKRLIYAVKVILWISMEIPSVFYIYAVKVILWISMETPSVYTQY